MATTENEHEEWENEEEWEADGEWAEEGESEEGDDDWSDSGDDELSSEDHQAVESQEVGRLKKFYHKQFHSFGYIECLQAPEDAYVYGQELVTALNISFKDASKLIGRFLSFKLVWNHRGPKAMAPIELLPEGFEGEAALSIALNRSTEEKMRNIKQERRRKQNQEKQLLQEFRESKGLGNTKRVKHLCLMLHIGRSQVVRGNLVLISILVMLVSRSNP